jgi:hypothetical protein
MDVLINESQRRLLIVEGLKDNLQEIKESAIDFSASLYKSAKKRFGFNLKILLTFGAAVGGLLQPLEQYLANKNPEMSSEQVTLVLIAITAVLFNESRDMTRKIVKKIKDENIEGPFFDGLRKTKKLVYAFKGFLGTLGNTAAYLSDVMAYVYMIPLIGYLAVSLQGGISDTEISNLVERLLAIGVFTISNAALTEIVKRIVNR